MVLLLHTGGPQSFLGLGFPFYNIFVKRLNLAIKYSNESIVVSQILVVVVYQAGTAGIAFIHNMV